MQIGKMRHRIELQSFSASKDSFGQEIKTYTTYATVWADVRQISGREMLNAQAAQSEITYRIYVRYNASIVITDRIVWDTRTLEINAVINTDGKKLMLELLCKEAA
jgi:SPP1 family predicted phage head-tail adaptor